MLFKNKGAKMVNSFGLLVEKFIKVLENVEKFLEKAVIGTVEMFFYLFYVLFKRLKS